jgi:hypothetical protein
MADSDRYARIYALAEPYWQTRSNEIHVPGSYALAQELLAAYPQADADVVLPAILLHAGTRSRGRRSPVRSSASWAGTPSARW